MKFVLLQKFQNVNCAWAVVFFFFQCKQNEIDWYFPLGFIIFKFIIDLKILFYNIILFNIEHWFVFWSMYIKVYLFLLLILLGIIMYKIYLLHSLNTPLLEYVPFRALVFLTILQSVIWNPEINLFFEAWNKNQYTQDIKLYCWLNPIYYTNVTYKREYMIKIRLKIIWEQYLR